MVDIPTSSNPIKDPKVNKTPKILSENSQIEHSNPLTPRTVEDPYSNPQQESESISPSKSSLEIQKWLNKFVPIKTSSIIKPLLGYLNQGFSSPIKVSQNPFPYEEPKRTDLSKTLQVSGSPTPLESYPIFAQVYDKEIPVTWYDFSNSVIVYLKTYFYLKIIQRKAPMV